VSLERRLKQARYQAMSTERARCLWVIDDIEREMREAVDNRIATPTELHVMKTKLRLALSITQKIKRGVLMGVTPTSPVDAAEETE
jgi:hypothetical protein